MSRSHLIAAGVLIGLFVLFFAELLFGGRLPAFRDAAHFYPPLFEFCRDEWTAGRVPLWNPYENFGQPLLADGVSSVFYPAKLLYFALPGDWAWRGYVLLHLPLAAGGAWLLARRYGASVEAATLAAAAYAFSGTVLGDVCNVVFLVGAAWLPWALLAAEGIVRQGRIRWVFALGVVLALMVLGGDPQMAYLAGLLAAVRCLTASRVEQPPTHVEQPPSAVLDPEQTSIGGSAQSVATVPHQQLPTHVEQPPSAVSEAGQTSVGGSAQSVATVPHQQSVATVPHQQSRATVLHLFVRLGLLALAAACALALAAVQILPSLEFAGLSTRSSVPVSERFTAKAAPDGHLEDVYQFSVGPWRLAEMAWPNVSGRQYPTHRRWLSELPAEGRVWTPTLYMGVLTLLLTLSAMRFRRAADASKEMPARFLTWIALAALCASFGWYGLGWLYDELVRPLGLQPLDVVGKPFGGLYWLMTVVLPGFVQFRYPAKLLIVAALPLALLAAEGFDRQFRAPSHRVRGAVGGFAIVSFLGCLAAVAVRPFWPAWFAAAAPDAMFGPFDAAGAWRDLASGFLQAGVVAAAGWWLLGRRRALGHFGRIVPAALVLLCGADLLLANRWLIATAPAERWHAPSLLAETMRREGTADGDGVRAMHHAGPVRPSWIAAGSANRLAEAVSWQRATLWPKFNLPERVALGDVYGAMMLADWEQFLAADSGGEAGDQPALRLAPWVITSRDAAAPTPDAALVAVADGVALWRDAGALPRAWIARAPRLDQPSADETCAVIDDAPQCVKLFVELRAPGTLILADPYYPGWTASVAPERGATTQVAIEKRLGALRAVSLPAGRQTVVFRYEPSSFRWGLAVSLTAWVGLAAGWVAYSLACGVRGRRPATAA